MLIRTAKYGKEFIRDSPILSITLQILFDDITDHYSNEISIYDQLWFTITTEGLKSLNKYSDYIVKEILNQQLNKEQSILFKVLREYYREKLFLLLQQSNIKDKSNLYQLALDNVTEFGWIIGLENIQNKMTPINYKNLFEFVNAYLQEYNQIHQKGIFIRI